MIDIRKMIRGMVIFMTAVPFVLSGCAGDSRTVRPEETEEASGNTEIIPGTGNRYTAFAGMNDGYSLNNNLAMKVSMENAGIQVEFNSVLDEDLAEKRLAILQTGNYPDLFFKAMFSADDLEKFGRRGIFIPLEDLIREYAPRLSALLDEIDGWDDLRSADGHIYSFPEIDRPSPDGAVCWINKRWMDNLGLEEPGSYEELYQVLKAFKEQDANGNGDSSDEIPMSLAGNTEMLLSYADYVYDRNSRTALIDGRLVYLPTDERYKEYIGYVARLYQEGLLDENTFMQQRMQLEAAGRSGDILGSFDASGAFEVVGRGEKDYIALTPFQEGTFPVKKGITVGAAVITNKCSHPEALAAWLDQFYDEAGGILAWMGVEGETYQLNEDGTWGWITDRDYGPDVSAVRAAHTVQGAQYHPSVQPELWSALSEESDSDEVYLTQQHRKLVSTGAVPFPVFHYSESESREVSTLATEMNAYIDHYVIEVATGELNLEESWDAYLKVLEGMGVGRLIDIYQTAYESVSR